MKPDVCRTRRQILGLLAGMPFASAAVAGLSAPTADDRLITYYASPGEHTTLAKDADAIRTANLDLAGLAQVVQGLLIHDFLAESRYGLHFSPAAQETIHLRQAQGVIDAARTRSAESIFVARAPEDRVPARCHHYAKLLTAALRAKGMAARTRCGYASYLTPGYFEDHWICEVWLPGKARWVKADATLDADWRALTAFKGNPLDLSATAFLTAGEAWQRCLQKQLDPARFGISHYRLHGLGMIASNLVRDVAALNKMEMLPWDIWGAQPLPNASLTPAQIAWFSDIARLTAEADRHWPALTARFAADPGLKVPEQIYNGLRQRFEPA